MRMLHRFFFSILFSASCAAFTFAEDWPHWRGPTYNGVSKAAGLPVTWGEDRNILWKTALPEFGCSTPIIVGDSIFLTFQAENDEYGLLRINKENGQIVWKRIVGKESPPRNAPTRPFRGWQKFNDLHNFASPSCAADRETVIAHFGSGKTNAFDWDGNLIWQVDLQERYGAFTFCWGHTSTPFLYKDIVIIPVMNDNCADIHEKFTDSYVVALDKKTGAEKWRVLRNTGSEGEPCDSYSTPSFWTHEGRDEILLFGGETLDAYNPETGERYWWLDEGLEQDFGVTSTPTPVESLGMIFFNGASVKPNYAVAPKGLDRQSVEVIRWTHTPNSPGVPSLVSDGKLVFSVNDANGIAQCFDAKTGEVHWQRRLGTGIWYSSPLLADGKVYFLNMDGLAVVVEAAAEYKVLAENHLEGRFVASPIVDGNRLILRSHTGLYCLTPMNCEH